MIDCDFLKTQDKNHICLLCLKPQDVVYYVHALGKQSFTTVYCIAGAPYLSHHTKAWFVHAYYGTELLYKAPTEFSLQDAGVFTNTYNQHKLFREADRAELYLNLCKGRSF